MFLKIAKLKLNQTNGNDGGNGAGTQTQTDTAQAEAQGSGTGGLDDMYGDGAPAASAAAPTSTTTTQDQGQQTQQTAQGQEDQTGSTTGYENAPEGDAGGDGAANQSKPDAQTTDSTVEIKINEEGLTKEQIAGAKEFLGKHKVTQEAANEYVALMKASTTTFDQYKQKIQEHSKTAETARRKAWHTELASDPDFGGANFQQNLKRVDTVLTSHLPSVKNMLTTSKGMLPPGVMRDLLKMHTILHGSKTTLVKPNAGQGDGNAEQNDEMAKLNEFYT